MSQAAELGCRRGFSRKAEPTQLRNEAPLNCVSLRSELDCEVSCEDVKGQDERRRSAAPLTASPLTPEVYAARKRTSKVSREDRQKGGDAVGRPSCQSSLLSDPNANFSVEMWRRSNIKEGRHVGLDFYDLLIEAPKRAQSTRLANKNGHAQNHHRTLYPLRAMLPGLSQKAHFCDGK
jgi:hypothetical protein